MPTPGVDASVSLPPRASLTTRTRCRPSPIPCPGGFVVKKGSTDLDKTSSLIPWIGDSGARLEGAELVTRLGPTYDFRNKRLPVWRLDYGEPVFASVFVDTATSGVADVLEDSDRPERFVFAFLHKWNFLFPLGRGVQSTVVATVVSLAIFLLGGTGFILNRRLRKRAGSEAV